MKHHCNNFLFDLLAIFTFVKITGTGLTSYFFGTSLDFFFLERDFFGTGLTILIQAWTSQSDVIKK
jgi:hypothetical protein